MFKERTNNPKWFMNKVQVMASPIHGVGIFATELIKKREIFESAPVVLFHIDLLNDYVELHNSKHVLSDHVFIWENCNHAMCLGYGSVYNHSNEPNAMHRRVFDKEYPRIEFIAKKDIQPGEEIFHHYSPKAGNLFFTDAGSFDAETPIQDLEKRRK